MLLQGTVSNIQSGLHDSIGAMHMQMELMAIGNKNVQGFDKVGYQRKDAVVSSFADVIGIHALSEAVDDKVGRIVETGQPLDLSIANKGYFQLLNKDGSRDIIVEYFDKGSEGYKKVINIAKDGKRTVNETGRRMLSL